MGVSEIKKLNVRDKLIQFSTKLRWIKHWLIKYERLDFGG